MYGQKKTQIISDETIEKTPIILNYQPLNVSTSLIKNKQGVYEATEFLKIKFSEGYRNFYFLPGTYIVLNLSLPSNLTLKGSGQGTLFVTSIMGRERKKLGEKVSATFISKSRKKLGSNNSKNILFSSVTPHTLIIRNKSNIHIEGIKFISTKTNKFFQFNTIDQEHIQQKFTTKSNFIDIKDAKNINLRKLNLEFNEGHGIKIQNSENISIQESNFKRLSVAIAINRSKNITVEENEIIISAIGIYVYDSKNTNIQNNFIANNEYNLTIKEITSLKKLKGKYYHKVHKNHIGHGEENNFTLNNLSIPTIFSNNTLSFNAQKELGNSDWQFHNNNFFVFMYNLIEFPSGLKIPHLQFTIKSPIYFIGNMMYNSFQKIIDNHEGLSTFIALLVTIYNLDKIIQELFLDSYIIKKDNINVTHQYNNKYNENSPLPDLFIKLREK